MVLGGVALSRPYLVRRLCWTSLAVSMLALWPLERNLERERAGLARVANVVPYVRSGKGLERFSLGHEGLLASIYWTRVVQYFGRQRMARASEFELLGPLLRITTELDPHLIIAYRFGSIFLAEKPPGGAGKPEEALALLRRGIVANPDYWRLWQDLGFIYYWDLKDYDRAARAFQTGSERPGAMVWMKVLAARVAAEGGRIGTSRMLWSEIYRHGDNEAIRRSAMEHLIALDAQEQMAALTEVLAKFRRKFGRTASSFREVAEAGLIRAIPHDPTGAPYEIDASGRVTLSRKSQVDLRLLQ